MTTNKPVTEAELADWLADGLYTQADIARLIATLRQEREFKEVAIAKLKTAEAKLAAIRCVVKDTSADHLEAWERINEVIGE